MPHEHDGSSGEMELVRDWHESGSGHTETTNLTKLVGRGENVDLLITSHTFRVFRSSEDSSQRYSIPVKELIQLIVKHGSLEKK